MLSPYLFIPLIQRVTICSSFCLDATSKDSWQYVTWQVKAKSNKQTKNLWIYFESVYGIIYLLRIWYLEENTVSPSYLHIHGFNQRMENIWKKFFHEIPKNKTWICYSSSTIYIALTLYLGFPGGSDSKESACNAGDTCLIHGLGRFPGEENGHPLQYSCLENSMNRAWLATVQGVAKSWTQLSN